MASKPPRKGMRLATFVLGLLLIAAAVYVAIGSVDWSNLRQAAPGDVALLAAAVLGNLLLTGLLFYSITRSFDAKPTVPALTMIHLICASGLLNMLPLRPGLLGRAAYLKSRHGLPIRQSVLTLLITMVLGAAVLGVVALAVLLAQQRSQGAAVWVTLIALLACSSIVKPVAQYLLKRPIVQGWLWIPLRIADMLVGGVRLYLAFGIIGQPIGFEQAVAIRAVGSLADMIPLTPNGLGLREWVQGGLASMVNLVEGPVGIGASLIDRAIEVIVLVMAGLVSMAMLRRVCPEADPPG